MLERINVIIPDSEEWQEKQRRIQERHQKAQEKRSKLERKRLEREFIINNLSQRIGKQGIIVLENLSIKVNILDLKQSFGHFRFLVSPISGSGKKWIDFENVDN